MRKFLILFVLASIMYSCNKTEDAIPKNDEATVTSFKNYIIESGGHYCNDNSFVPTSVNALNFMVKFDSSAVYSTTDPGNQDDINKLYGFADNNAQHHQYSARIGWRWSNNALRLFGYTYNEGIVDSKELAPVDIGKENLCSIKITPQHYIFSINGMMDSLRRKSTTVKAEGYKLYPYFGGDEAAPHKITILIKDL